MAEREDQQSEADFARLMLACPHYRAVGFCVTGCTTEPYCETGQPPGGWESLLAAGVRTTGGTDA